MSTTPDPEAAALIWFLDAQRSSVLAIIDGLPEDALRANVLPSGWTPIGLVEHLGYAERHWFQQVMRGSEDELPWPTDDSDDTGPLETNRSTETVLAFYRNQCARSNAVLSSTPLDTAPAGRHGDWLDDEVFDLRRIALHLIEETARHAGHRDVVRELLDGRTGLGGR
jgi:hypothetical protein